MWSFEIALFKGQQTITHCYMTFFGKCTYPCLHMLLQRLEVELSWGPCKICVLFSLKPKLKRLSIPSKVLTRILLEGLKTAVNNTLRDEHSGFRADRSCIDQIANTAYLTGSILGVAITSVHQFHWLQENLRHDWHKHRVEDNETLWDPLKIVSIIHSLYNGMTCQVIHNDLWSPFIVTTGVRQGCLLSPMIFPLVVDWVLNQTMDQPRSLQWTFAKTQEDFADDIGLLFHYFKHIQEKSQRLSTVALQTWLEINT